MAAHSASAIFSFPKEASPLKAQYLEAGKIVNTHGIAGEVKIIPWADGPEFLLDFDTLYIDGKPMEVQRARVHKTVSWPNWPASTISTRP